MNRIRIAYSSVSCKWTIDGLLRTFPTPGTDFFSDLATRLRAYQLTAQGVSFQAPTAQLSDVVLTLVFWEGRATIKISYDWFEIAANDFAQEEVTDLLKIAESLIESLKNFNPGLSLARGLINSRLHADFQDTSVQVFLQRHLPAWEKTLHQGSGCGHQLIPDGLAYNFVGQPDGEGLTSAARVVAAKSLQRPNAVFLDLYVEYSPPPEVQSLAALFEKDLNAIFRVLDLSLEEGEGG